MDVALVLVTLSLAVHNGLALSAILMQPVHPRYPGHCIDPDVRNPIPFGTKHYEPGQCMLRNCFGNETGFIIEYEACPAILGHPPCPVVEDKDVLFPECCLRLHCS
ncbi:U-scoloptoxin(16)-Ssd1a [Anabrus simplex]|uniref:U-scoloptoxin(16)-Ssd1a n=1 Tax=Anabrus simplex TaxID=316456 RepID=UPI0034DD1FB5